MYSYNPFFESYLFAFVFWCGLSMGCYGLMLLHYVVRGSWGQPVIRLFEAGAKTLPLMALLFFGGYFAGMKELYPWNHPDVVAADTVLKFKSAYLNSSFFLARSAGYFLIWWGLFTLPLTRWSVAEDKTGDAKLAQKRTDLSAFGLVIFFLTTTIAFTDWVMSLDKHWFSTIYGVWFVVGQGLLTFAFVTAYLLRRLGKEPYTEAVVTKGVQRDLGNFMLTFTMLWAYISLSQFLIQWSGNLPEEISYYYTRTQPGWLELGTIILLGQFFAPFLMLLSSRAKRTPQLLTFIACWIIVARILDVFWVVIPAFPNRHSMFNIMDVVMFAVVGALWYSVFQWLLKANPLLPQHVARGREVLDHA